MSAVKTRESTRDTGNQVPGHLEQEKKEKRDRVPHPGNSLAWLTNGMIAWAIPGPRIDTFYLFRVYSPLPGWTVIRELEGANWHPGSCGEMRKQEARA